MTTLPNAGGGCAHACTHGAALSFAGSLGVSIGNGLAGGLDTYLRLAMWSLGKPRSRERGGVPGPSPMRNVLLAPSPIAAHRPIMFVIRQMTGPLRSYPYANTRSVSL